jgi:hypothetical protein
MTELKRIGATRRKLLAAASVTVLAGMAMANASLAQQAGQTAVAPLAAGAGAVDLPPPSAAPGGAMQSLLQQQQMLIRLLAAKGILTADQAKSMLDDAQRTAQQASKEAQQAAQQAAPPRAAAAPIPVVSAAGATTHVPYIPETTKKEIEQHVREQVMQQARSEGWAAPDALPEWTKRFHLYGDARLRYEGDLFNRENNRIDLINYQAINNNGSGGFSALDIGPSSSALPPILNTTQDRDRARIRGRLGVTAQIDDSLTADVRVTTGDTQQPVTQNQTLGNSFNKNTIVLDRFYLDFHPVKWANIVAGRIPNPWFSTNLVWADDLGFDGVAAHFSHDAPFDKNVNGFLTLGAFPLQFTDFNLAVNADPTQKASSYDKWLLAAQTGATWKIDKQHTLTAAAAYYDFLNYDGRQSSPCTTLAANDPCSSDNTRPFFVQKGNSLFPLRQFTSDATGLQPNYQLFGLASQFRELNVTARFDAFDFDPIHLIADVDFVTNLAFDKNVLISKGEVNNFDVNGNVVSGSNAYFVKLTAGFPEVNEFLKWNLYGGYKYIEPDALVDAFTDSDFNLGGTNTKGYIIGGNFGLAHNTWLNLRWFSADNIVGPSKPLSIDVVQVDLNAKF